MHTCRTAVRGGRIVQCPKCYTRTIIYNPCNTRGCPICSSRNKVLWQKKVSKKLLPVSHYHLVFSIPSAFTTTWLRNKKRVAEILFKSVSKVIAELRASTGLLCGSALDFQSHGRGMSYKPHIHCSEILQKFINYQFKFAIVGDFSGYTSKPLKDFIYESNKGRDIFFVSSEEDAIEKLSRT